MWSKKIMHCALEAERILWNVSKHFFFIYNLANWTVGKLLPLVLGSHLTLGMLLFLRMWHLFTSQLLCHDIALTGSWHKPPVTVLHKLLQSLIAFVLYSMSVKFCWLCRLLVGQEYICLNDDCEQDHNLHVLPHWSRQKNEFSLLF